MNRRPRAGRLRQILIRFELRQRVAYDPTGRLCQILLRFVLRQRVAIELDTPTCPYRTLVSHMKDGVAKDTGRALCPEAAQK